MNTDDLSVSAKILSDIKLIRESYSRPVSDAVRAMLDMSQRIATGAYLVTQHLSDRVSLKMSVRSAADTLVDVVYATGGDNEMSYTYNVMIAVEKVLSFLTIARSVGVISDINGLLIEREILKLSRIASTMLVKGEVGFAEHLMRERSDVRLKMIDLFDSSEVDQKKARPRVTDRIQRSEATPVVSHKPEPDNSDSHSNRHSEISPRDHSVNDTSIALDSTISPRPNLPVQNVAGEKPEVSHHVEVGPSSTVPGQMGGALYGRDEVIPREFPSMSGAASATVPNTGYSAEREYANHSSMSESASVASGGQSGSLSQSNQSRGVTPVFDSTKSRSVAGQSLSSTEVRRQQILQFIRENGIVSIKDIASGVRGVSDKTLQRALIDLVNDKVIIRHGDRRWSRYEATI